MRMEHLLSIAGYRIHPTKKNGTVSRAHAYPLHNQLPVRLSTLRPLPRVTAFFCAKRIRH